MAKKKTKTEQFYGELQVGETVYVRVDGFYLPHCKGVQKCMPHLVEARIWKKDFYHGGRMNLMVTIPEQEEPLRLPLLRLVDISRDRETMRSRLQRELTGIARWYRTRLKAAEKMSKKLEKEKSEELVS